MIEEKEIEKDLRYSKSGKTAITTRTRRACLADNRYGFSESVVDSSGNFTKVFHNDYKYTSIRRITLINKGCFYIRAKHSIDGSEVDIFKVKSIDNNDKKIFFKQVAYFKDNKWNNTEYIKSLKKAIKSTLMKAKKFYNLSDIQ